MKQIQKIMQGCRTSQEPSRFVQNDQCVKNMGGDFTSHDNRIRRITYSVCSMHYAAESPVSLLIRSSITGDFEEDPDKNTMSI